MGKYVSNVSMFLVLLKPVECDDVSACQAARRKNCGHGFSSNTRSIVTAATFSNKLCCVSQVIATLKGHLDFSFASAWHPDGVIFATGNQDTTCRLWDLRNPSSAVGVLKGRIGAVRSLRFTTDGRFMAMAEPADFVHVYDTKHGYNQCQEIDLFGEVAGISFSADTEALFVGVADRNYGSLLEFNRTHTNYDADFF